MDQQLLQHLLTLAAKTGDRLIVVDPATQRPFVLMDLTQYEALRGVGSPVVPKGATPSSFAALQQSPMPAAPSPMVAFAEAGQYVPVDLGEMARAAERKDASVRYAPEPATAALPDDDRFYVEPLE